MNPARTRFLQVVAIFAFSFVFPASAVAQDARAHYEEGMEALAVDDFYEAVHSFRSALNVNPAYLEARLGMIRTLFLLTEFDEAYREAEAAKAYAPRNRALSLLEARIFVALGKDDEAAEIYGKILEERPHDPEANRGLAEYYAINGQKELAERTFDRSLRYEPGDKRVLMHLVLLYDESLDREAAEPVLQEALRLFPDDFHVRMLAAEHYARYEDWNRAAENLDRVESMLRGTDDPRSRRVALVGASLALRRGDPESALVLLGELSGNDDPSILFLTAMAMRETGNENGAQRAMERLVSAFPEDEIARMYREESLVRTTRGFDEYRSKAAAWHLEAGRRFEEVYYFDRALSEYRRAIQINGTDPNARIVYADLIRKKGFPDKYRDSLEAAVVELEGSGADASDIIRKISLQEHSRISGVADDWGIDDPWSHMPASCDVAVFVSHDDQSLPHHSGAAPTLAYFFADALDTSSRLTVVDPDGGFGLDIGEADSFADAFRRSRSETDYFVMLSFYETERSFGASAALYLSRTGEPVGRFEEMRTGNGMVGDVLANLASEMERAVPEKMRILAVDGDRILLDKGRWHGIESKEPLPVLRKGQGRPAVVENGIDYPPSSYLGTAVPERIAESLCEASFERAGDFDFVAPGDEVFLLPVPEDLEENPVTDPAFRARLLAVP